MPSRSLFTVVFLAIFLCVSAAWADTIDLTYLKMLGSIDGGDNNTFQARKASGISQTSEEEAFRGGVVQRTRAWYHDQIPPFDIVLVALNEYGHAARMVIRGVEILNAGSGISIDDITVDENMTFVATDIIPWRSLGWADPENAPEYGQKTTEYVGM